MILPCVCWKSGQGKWQFYHSSQEPSPWWAPGRTRQQKSPHYTRQAIFTHDMMYLHFLCKSADLLRALLSLPETNNGRSAVWVRWKRHNFLLFSYIFLWYSSCSCNLLCLECNKIARWVKPLSSRTQNNNKFFSSWKSAVYSNRATSRFFSMIFCQITFQMIRKERLKYVDVHRA